jgi:hypothetical protein
LVSPASPCGGVVASADVEEYTVGEAAEALGMSSASVSQWVNRAPPDVWRKAGSKRVLLWPAFPVWYRAELQKNSAPADLDEARRRKLAAEAELAELQLERERGALLTVADFRRELGDALDLVRSRVTAMTARLAPQVVGLSSVAEAQAAIDPLVREILRELSEAGE